jgi:hypothetical protein
VPSALLASLLYLLRCEDCWYDTAPVYAPLALAHRTHGFTSERSPATMRAWFVRLAEPGLQYPL